MLDIKFIREYPDKVKEACEKKGIKSDVSAFLDLDKKKIELMIQIENLRAKQNLLTREQIDEGKKIKGTIKSLEPEFNAVREKWISAIRQFPNIPHDDVPVGKDESENKVIRSWGKIPKFSFPVKDHVQLGGALNLIDNETASKVSGTRFTYLKNELAILQFALISHAFSVLTSESVLKKMANSVKKGFSAKAFTPIIPPVMIKPAIYEKMARLEPKEERYYISSDDIYLIGSAEHTLGPVHMDEVLLEQNLPVRYVGYSTAFRREAGSYGKDTKGILRMHQFDKIEMESFSKPEDSVLEQNFFVAIQEYLLQALEIPYRVVMICTGDMGKPDARQIDIECWMPGQNKYRETHTADLMTDYQARRLNTRLRRRDGKMEFVHMNDATVFAIGRTLIAILENFQQKDGSVKVPTVLQKYTGFKVIKPNKK